MSTESATAAAATPTPGKVVSAGGPQPAQIPSAYLAKPDEEEGIDKGTTGSAELSEEEKIAAAKLAEEQAKIPDLNDDQLRDLLKSKGIELDDKGIEGLKEKLKPAAAATELTAEQKAAEEAALDKRMLDVFIANGGTAEAYVAFKQIANSDLTELSASELRREMKGKGFSPEEIEEMIKERYYQVKIDELVRDEENETEEEFEARKAKLQKKLTYGTEKLNARGSYLQKQAKDSLNTILESIKVEDLLKQKEAEFSSKVDEKAKLLPRKLTFQLGKVNDQEIAPIDYDVNETDIVEVVDTLKDPAKRNKFFYNEDRSLNLDNIADVMLRNKVLESAIKAVYLEGGDRQVAVFEKLFPGRTAKDIGVGGATGGSANGRKGVIKSAGSPQPATLPK